MSDVSTVEDTRTARSRHALALAQVARLDAAALRHEVKAGILSVSQALGDPRAAPLRIGVLLESFPGYGPRSVQWALARAGLGGCQITPDRRVRELTDRQRKVLASRMELARAGARTSEEESE